MPLTCARHVVYDDDCQKCNFVRVMNAIARLESKTEIALTALAQVLAVKGKAAKRVAEDG